MRSAYLLAFLTMFMMTVVVATLAIIVIGYATYGLISMAEPAVFVPESLPTDSPIINTLLDVQPELISDSTIVTLPRLTVVPTVPIISPVNRLIDELDISEDPEDSEDPVDPEASKRLADASSHLDSSIATYDPAKVSGSPEEFRMVANGFFQAEGFVGVLFRNILDLTLFPLISMNQLYSVESVRFLVRLHHDLGCVGTFSIYYNATHKLMIMYRLKG